MAEHARLSASGAKKWLNCPASIRLEEQFPNKGSVYAEEGTKAHAVGELKLRLLNKEINIRQYNTNFKKLEISEEMDEYTSVYSEYINAEKNCLKPHTFLIEKKLKYTNWVKNGFGTGDCVMISKDTIAVFDLKYGKGVKVSATDNEQLKLYVLGVVQEYGWLQDFKVIELHIVQPRIDNIDSSTVTYDELMYFAEEVKEKALLTENKDSPCVVGDWCDSGFCRAKSMCKAYANRKLALQSYEYKSPDLLTTDELEDVCNIADKLVSWAKIIKEYALDLALKGHKFSSLKAVEGKSSRKIIEDIDVIKSEIGDYYKTMLNKDLTKKEIDELIYIKKIKSITDFEKAFGKKVLNDTLNGIWIKGKGAPTLVPINDKRPALDSVESDLKKFNSINKELKI